MDPHTLIPILTSIGIKYLLNIGNWLEDITSIDLPNLGKQAAVVILAYAATKIPQIQQYLPQITPWAQAMIAASPAAIDEPVSTPEGGGPKGERGNPKGGTP